MYRLSLFLILPLLVGCSAFNARPVPPILYQVTNEDTLSQIAARFGVSEDALSEMNQISTVKALRAGTIVQLPEVPSEQLNMGNAELVSAGAKQSGARALVLGRARRYVARLIWPIRGARMSSPFGMRSSKFHEGVDLSAPQGAAIYAAHDGEVVFAGRGLRGYGKLVVLQAEGIVTVYAHNSSIDVESGERIKAGQQIAQVGQTGDATGPHLHFEIRVQDVQRRYVAVDPMAFYRRVKGDSQVASAGSGRRKPL